MSKNSRASTRRRTQTLFRLIFFNIKILKTISLLCSRLSVIKDCSADYPLPTASVSPVSTQAEPAGSVGPPILGALAAQCGALSPETLEAMQGAAADGLEARQGPPSALPGTAEGGWRRTERSPQLPRCCILSPAAGVAGAAPAPQPNIFHLTTEMAAVWGPTEKTHLLS